jgi:histidyl-tRNA synthetase
VAKRQYIIQIIKFREIWFSTQKRLHSKKPETLMEKYGRRPFNFKILNSGDYLAKTNASHLENRQY